jgi:uncharacterized repeat protein (TIGR03803 family)
MKNRIEHLLIALACTGLLAMSATAQTFTNLHSFGADTTNGYGPVGGLVGDGDGPVGGLILSGNTLYGTTEDGGTNFEGAVFKVNTDGLGYRTLYSFSAVSGPLITNTDGTFPRSTLILSGNTLYGTAQYGGSAAGGTVFAVNTDGTGFTNLHNFTGYTGGSDGYQPCDGLILSGSTLYGTTELGAENGEGTVFAVNTNGTGFTNLYTFTSTSSTNGDNPLGGLVLSGINLYGTTVRGGSPGGNGTVFVLNTNGAGFKVLHTFSDVNGSGFNSDGAHPDAALILSGANLYGTANSGGSSGYGTVFAANTNGMAFTTLHSFSAVSGPLITNTDGTFPQSTLILSGNTLYGTAEGGGANAFGTVFGVNTNGTFTTLHNFAGYPSDGDSPYAGLILSGNTLYGTTFLGGTFGEGTVFSLTLPPSLSIMLSGGNVILTWPTNATGYKLQSITNLVPSAAWNTVSPAPVVVNTNNAVTNAISGTQQFFRLANP